jgi:uncharacterized membrane protein YuzA (DUF378 family)
MKNMKFVHMLTFTLVIVGALNWGLIGLLNLNLVHMILGMVPVAEQAVYVLVGISAVYIAATHMSDCKMCKMK